MHSEPKNDNAISSGVAAALLGSSGRILNGWPMLFALAALRILSMRPVGIFSALACGASLVGAVAQPYFAVRCAFDAAVFARNPQSMRVLEKVGFVREGIRRRSVFKDGQLIDSVMYALVADV